MPPSLPLKFPCFCLTLLARPPLTRGCGLSSRRAKIRKNLRSSAKTVLGGAEVLSKTKAAKHGGSKDDTRAALRVGLKGICWRLEPRTPQEAMQQLALQARRADKQLERASARAGQELAALVCQHAGRGDDEELERLLDKLPASDIPGDYDNRHGMHLAAAAGHREALIVLIVAGGDVNVVDRFGRTPLAEAVLNGKDECIQLLREEGAELMLSGERLAGKLCSAGAAGDCALIRRYLSAGADPDAADYDKRTALMLAASEGSGQVCELLLEGGADPTASDRWGHSAANEAKENNRMGIHAMIVKAVDEWPTLGRPRRDKIRRHYLAAVQTAKERRTEDLKRQAVASADGEKRHFVDTDEIDRRQRAAVVIQKNARRRSCQRSMKTMRPRMHTSTGSTCTTLSSCSTEVVSM